MTSLCNAEHLVVVYGAGFNCLYLVARLLLGRVCRVGSLQLYSQCGHWCMPDSLFCCTFSLCAHKSSRLMGACCCSGAQVAWRAMEGLVSEGLVRSLGIQDASVEVLTEVLGYAAIPPAVHFLVVHPGNRNDALLAFCRCQVRRFGSPLHMCKAFLDGTDRWIILLGHLGVPRHSFSQCIVVLAR